MKRGFTLLEVLAASALFFVAVAGVFSSFNVAAKITRHFEFETIALHVADGFLEELVLRPRDSADLQAGPHPDHPALFGDDGEPAAGGRYALTWTVREGLPKLGLRTVDVAVTWLEGQQTHQVRMSTVRE